jgi:hypothetical protein
MDKQDELPKYEFVQTKSEQLMLKELSVFEQGSVWTTTHFSFNKNLLAQIPPIEKETIVVILNYRIMTFGDDQGFKYANISFLDAKIGKKKTGILFDKLPKLSLKEQIGLYFKRIS